MRNRYTIGIDIGGTRTHAVLCEGDKVIVAVNKTNLVNVKHGLVETLKELLFAANQIQPVYTSEISAIMVGTTQFVNSTLQSKGLSKVFTIRLGAPATTAINPASDWPQSLKWLIGNDFAIIEGGYEFNGQVISELNPLVVEALAHKITSKGINCIAVSCVFSQINPNHELTVYEILKRINPNFKIFLSHQIGDLGLLARENATILNAAIYDAFETYRQELKNALFETNLSHATLLLSSNNGTLERAEDILPVKTYGSGPSNSIRGASILFSNNAKYSIVADVGGTSTDIGINVNGFPMQAGTDILIGNEKEGFTCNFPSPLTVSCALGGGSIIFVDQDEQITVGTQSVGNNLKHLAKCFGGDVLTVTDIAVAKGRLKGFGNQALLQNIPNSIIEKADELIHIKLAEMINAAVIYINSKEYLRLVLVGGGASLFDLNKLKPLLDSSIQDEVIPKQAESANAIGAAVAMIQGQYSKVYQYEDTATVKGQSRASAIADARKNAIQHAVEKGADLNTIKDIGVTEIPLTYLPGALHNVKVEVIGMVDAKNINKVASPLHSFPKAHFLPTTHAAPAEENIDSDYLLNNMHSSTLDIQIKNYYADMAIGAGLLGSGGGGDTLLGTLMINQLVETGYRPELIDINSLEDENDLIVAVAAMGTPSVGIEKLFSKNEFNSAINHYEKMLGKKITAIIPLEGAGFNALLPFLVSAACNKPLVDADCMGRAFPELQMTMPYIYGKNQIPYNAVLSSCSHAEFINAENSIDLENKARNITIDNGGAVIISCMPMTGKQVKSWCVPGTLSFCQKIGELIRTTRIDMRVTELSHTCEESVYGPINSLGSGKIIELNRYTEGGFNHGWIIIETTLHDKIKIEFQNENLRAINCTTNHVIAIVPDIITLLDIKGKAISSEMLRSGMEVSSILTIGAPALLKTPQALATLGANNFKLPPVMHVRNVQGLTLYTVRNTIEHSATIQNELTNRHS